MYFHFDGNNTRRYNVQHLLAHGWSRLAKDEKERYGRRRKRHQIRKINNNYNLCQNTKFICDYLFLINTIMKKYSFYSNVDIFICSSKLVFTFDFFYPTTCRGLHEVGERARPW